MCILKFKYVLECVFNLECASMCLFYMRVFMLQKMSDRMSEYFSKKFSGKMSEY